ncbi:MAG: DNA repair protein RecO [Planctomycetota bacterium]
MPPPPNAPPSDRALVLKRYRYGESSLVVHALTPGHGRLHLLAKGAYRPTSGYCGVLDLFDTLQLSWRRKRGAELGVLAGADVVHRRRPLSADLARYRGGLAVLELAGLAAQPDRADPDLFALAERWLGLLCDPAVPPGLALVAFDLRFLQNLGLSPALTACAACGGPAPPVQTGAGARGRASAAAFSAGAGGRLCPRCAEEARSSGRRVGTLPVNVLRIAQSLHDAAPEHLARFRLNERALDDVRSFVQHFLDYHLETRPRSRATSRSTAR